MVAHLLFLYSVRHKPALIIIRHGPRQHYLFAFCITCPQILGYLVFIIAYHIIGYVQYCLRAAVVLLQLHYFHILIIVLELQNVLHRGPAKRVDALCIVSHYAYVLMSCPQHFYDRILCKVRILVLIYKYILETSLVFCQRLRKMGQ